MVFFGWLVGVSLWVLVFFLIYPAHTATIYSKKQEHGHMWIAHIYIPFLEISLTNQVVLGSFDVFTA